MPDMLSSGSLDQVSLLMIEWHEQQAGTKERRAANVAIKKLVESMNITLTMDDEWYGKSDFPLPNCKSSSQ